MKRPVKITLWVVGSIVAICLIAIISVDIWASRMANSAIQRSLAKTEDIELVMRVGDIHIGLLTGMIDVEDFYMASDTGTFDTSKRRKKAGMEVYVPHVTIEMINYYELLRHRHLQMFGITVRNPHAVVWMDEKHPEACVPVFPKDTSINIADMLKSVDIGRVRVLSASAELKSVRTSLHTKADNLTAQAYDLEYELDDKHFGYNDSEYELSVGSLYLKFPDGSKELNANDLRTEDAGPIMLGETRLRDLVSSKQMAKKVQDQVTWIDLTVNHLRTCAINPIHKALDKDWTLDSLYVDVRRMHAIREAEYKPKSPFPVPQEILMKIPAKFEVKSVHADVRTIDVELTMTGNHYGKLQLKDITAHLSNVTNKKNAVWTNSISAPMGDGHIEATLAMHMNKHGQFDCELYGENFDLGVLNPFIRPLVGLTFDSHVDKLETCFSGDDKASKGEFLMMYHGLEVGFHQEEEVSVEAIQKFGKTIEGFANNLIPKSNPTVVDIEPRRYEVEWKRDEWKPYPLYIFGPCIDGTVKTMLPGLYVHKQIHSTNMQTKTTGKR